MTWKSLSSATLYDSRTTLMTGQTSQASHWLSSKFEPAQSWWECMRVDECWRSNESESCDSHPRLIRPLNFIFVFLGWNSSYYQNSWLTWLFRCIRTLSMIQHSRPICMGFTTARLRLSLKSHTDRPLILYLLLKNVCVHNYIFCI